MKLKLKLTRTSLLLIVAGICFIVSIILSLSVSQQVQQQSQLKGKLISTQSNLKVIRLEPLTTQQAELEKKLSEATSQFEAAKAMFLQPAGGTDPDKTFFNVAKANGLEVTEVTLTGLDKDTLGGLDCSSLLLKAKVEGNLPNLLSFITKLKNSMENGVIKSVTITIPETASSENTSADIQVVIYTYGGA